MEDFRAGEQRATVKMRLFGAESAAMGLFRYFFVFFFPRVRNGGSPGRGEDATPALCQTGGCDITLQDTPPLRFI